MAKRTATHKASRNSRSAASRVDHLLSRTYRESAMSSSTLGGGTGALPADVTGFVGRRHEVAEVKRLLSTSRLVCLIGVGGVGKTRLAVRAAADLHRAFDEIRMVELADLEQPALLSQTVAAAVGLQDTS